MNDARLLTISTEETGLTTTRHLPAPLTAAEKNEKHEQLVRTINDLKRLEENFALLKEQHKANVKARTTSINELSQDLGAGFVMRPISCAQEVDLNRNRMITRRLDTHEQVDERALTADEIKHWAKKK